MSSEQAKSKYFQLKVILLLVLLVFFWLLFEYARLVYKSYSIDLKKEWFEGENARLTQENLRLSRQFEYYQTDYFLVREAKRKLNKKLPGEKVLVVSDGPLHSTAKKDWWKGLKNPQIWWNYFFGDSVYDEVEVILDSGKG